MYPGHPSGYVPPVCKSGHVERYGCRVLPYLDDLLFVFADRTAAQAGAEWIQSLLYWLGFTPHPTKSVWEPTQQLEHLGLLVDLQQGTLSVPAAKVSRLTRLAKGLLVTAKLHRRLVAKRDLAAFCGYAQSVRLAVMPANLFLRSLYDACSTVTGWGGSVRLSRQALRDLEWWTTIPERHLSAPIWLRPASVELFVDASDSGWGAVLPALADSPDGVARGHWTPDERHLHINLLEMRAVKYALLSFRDVVRDRVVKLYEDNTVTQSVLGRFASRSPVLMQEYRSLWALLDSLHVHLHVVRLASAHNLADAPSRLVDRSDYQLDPLVFHWLDKLWGPHTIDLFASDTNAQLSAFYSLHRCPGSLGVDAFLQSWRGHNAWAHPPFTASILLQLVQKQQQFCMSASSQLANPGCSHTVQRLNSWAQQQAPRQHQRKYGLSTASVAAAGPFHLAIVDFLQQQYRQEGLQPDASCVSIAGMIGARLSPASWQPYSSVFGMFVHFCVSRDLQFLPAAPLTGVMWAEFLASKGSVKAAAAWPYFSAVNTVHTLLGFDRPCADNAMLVSFRRGWERQQVTLQPPPAVAGLALPQRRHMHSTPACLVLGRLQCCARCYSPCCVMCLCCGLPACCHCSGCVFMMGCYSTSRYIGRGNVCSLQMLLSCSFLCVVCPFCRMPFLGCWQLAVLCLVVCGVFVVILCPPQQRLKVGLLPRAGLLVLTCPWDAIRCIPHAVAALQRRRRLVSLCTSWKFLVAGSKALQPCASITSITAWLLVRTLVSFSQPWLVLLSAQPRCSIGSLFNHGIPVPWSSSLLMQ